MRAAALLPLLALPSALAAQDDPAAVRARLDSLLATPAVDTVLEGLGARFMDEIRFLVPDLSTDNAQVLGDAVADAFDPPALRADLAAAMARDASADTLEALLAARHTGAAAALDDLAARYEPPGTLAAFVAGLGPGDRERAQLMADLAQARGAGDFELLLEEALRRAATVLVAQLGMGAAPFEPMPDDQFQAAYKRRIVDGALELLWRLQPAPDSLVRRAVEEGASGAERWYVDAYALAMQGAVASAGERVAALTTTEPDEVRDAEEHPPAPPPPPPEPGLPCRDQACGLVVDWQGRVPTETNRRFGAAGDLEARVFGFLSRGGYTLTRGRRDGGLTLQLRPRLILAACDALPGTDTRGCPAIDAVQVDFLGAYPGRPTPDGFTVRNRCGSDGVMAVDGIAALVSLWIDYALTGGKEAGRPEPRC